MNISKIFMVQRPFVSGQPGFVLLISVLIIGAVGLAITTSVLLLSVGSSRALLRSNQSYQSGYLANSCAENALIAINKNLSYSGTGNIVSFEGECTFMVQNQGGQNRQITVSSTIGIAVKKITIIIDKLTPKIHILSWQEF